MVIVSVIIILFILVVIGLMIEARFDRIDRHLNKIINKLNELQ